MATYTLGPIYNIFLYATIFFKVLFIILNIRLKYFEFSHEHDNNDYKKKLLIIMKF